MMQDFFDSMHLKFMKRSECQECNRWAKDEGVYCSHCNDTGIAPGRSLTPWSEYDWSFLRGRLHDEISEYTRAMGKDVDYSFDVPVTDAAADELLDIANFAAFLWLKWRMTND